MKNHRSPSLVFALILAWFLALGTSARAQSYSTNNGAWSNAATWNTPPVNGASASVSGSNTVTFQAGDSYTGGYSIYTGLDVGQNFRANPGSGVLNVTGGTLRTGSLLVGHDGVGYGGTINVSGGQMIIDGGTMLFGWGASSSLNVSGSGTVTMSGTLDAGAPYFNFGHSAQSFLNISNAGTVNIQRAVTVQSGSVVDVNGANSTLNFSDAANLNLVADESKITAENGGSINMSGGQVTINGGQGLWLGQSGTTSTLNLSGGTWTQTGMLRLGVFASGNGVINQTGGVFELGNNIEVWGSSASSYNLSGGTFRLLGNYAINNYSGGSTFNITGASGNVTMDTHYDFTLLNTSTFNNAAATLTKTGSGTLTFSGSQLQIANGALDMQDGTIETASSLAIGIGGSSAAGTMSGGTLKTGYIQAANFIVGYGQTGTFTQSNGAVDVGSQANTVFGWSGGTGTYTLSGGTFSAAADTYLGLSSGTGTVDVNGGSFSANNLNVGGNGATAGTLNLNGGTLGVTGNFTVGAAGTININSGGSLSGGSGNDVAVANNGLVNFNGGTGNSSMNLKLAGGTVDVNGQAVGADSWANLCATTPGAVLKNSSSTAASIAAGNTIWVWDGGQDLTIDASGGHIQIDSRITSSGQTTQTGIIKTGPNSLVLTGANDYTGSTAVNAGTLILVNGSGLGSTAGGTTVASGAQLRFSVDINVSSGFTIGNEALTISGPGVNDGGALRNVFGNNICQGKITLAADAKIGAAGGYSLTLDVASGNAIEAANHNLTFDGAGTTLVSDGISLGTGGITKIGSGIVTLAGVNSYTGTTTVNLGSLVVSNASLSATISNNSVAVTFASAPSAGTTYTVLPGALAGNSLVSPSVTGLGSGQTATLTNDPNLVVKVSAANGYSTWLNGQPANSANQLAYAIGGATSSTATNGVPSVTTVTSNTLSTTAIVRTNDPNLAVYGQSILTLAAGTWTTNDVTNSVPVDQTGATAGTTQKQTFTTPYGTNNAKKFLRLQTTLINQ